MRNIISLLLFMLCIAKTTGFLAEFLGLSEEQPLQFVSGTCYFWSKTPYFPGEFQVVVKTDKPTLDLYSQGFVTVGRLYEGMSHKLINLNPLPRGWVVVEFTIPYYGSTQFYPIAWCENITKKTKQSRRKPVPSVPKTTTSPIRPEIISTRPNPTEQATVPTKEHPNVPIRPKPEFLNYLPNEPFRPTTEAQDLFPNAPIRPTTEYPNMFPNAPIRPGLA